MHIFLIILLFFLTGCADLSPRLRWQHAAQLTEKAGWEKLRLPAGEFVLTSYVPASVTRTDTLTVYIEGDGLAWISRSEASLDPTPRNPVGLELAMRQPQGVAVYLARPCQYVDEADWGVCRKTYWTDRRFSNEVIESVNQAISALKLRLGSSRLVLVGYSGGGAVAALVAARRNDVIQLVTVAGNLDHRTWTAMHHDTALDRSLNPADEWRALQYVPQKHLIGERDDVIGAEVSQAYVDRFPANYRPERVVIPGFGHTCCWVEKWPEIWVVKLK